MSTAYPFERFTERAKRALVLAQQEAEGFHHSYIGTEHVLLGLLRERDGLAAKVLDNFGVDMRKVRDAIHSMPGHDERADTQSITPTPRAKKVIEISFEESRRMDHSYVGTEHLLLGLLIEGEGTAARVLGDLGVTIEKTRREINRLLVSTGPEVYRVSDRVLVHDPDPPHRLWEGRVMGAEDLFLEIFVPGRAEGEFVRAAIKFVHSIPVVSTRDCPFCKGL